MLPPPPPKNYKISSAFSYNFRLALTIKTARLEELNALLNMDNKEQPEVEPEPPKKSREKEWER